MSRSRSAELAELISAGGVVVLSGAGISTDSGIPDYRGDGKRIRRAPIDYCQFVGDPFARRRYWARSHIGWRRMSRAEPNLSHHLVAGWEADGWIDGVITQNVDGLHWVAGSRRVLELHGSLADTVCLECGDRRSRLELHHRLLAANPRFEAVGVELAPDGDAQLPDELVEAFVVVDCLDCGGLLKPDVVFFGESVPPGRVQRAFGWLEEASALLVLGSSLTVMSGYRFLLEAHRSGKPIAIVNRGPTRGDGQATIRIEGGLVETLTELDEGLRGRVRPYRSVLRSVPL